MVPGSPVNFITKGRKEMNKTWLKAAAMRALKTICQTAVALIGTTLVMEDINWLMVGSASLLAGIVSILTSAAGLPEVGVKADLRKADEENQDGLQ